MDQQINQQLNQLRQLLGESGLLLGESVRQRTTSWLDPSPCQAAAIIRPANSNELATALKLCNDNNITVIPLGGKTGLVGAVNIQPEQVGLSLERMNKILTLDPKQKIAIVEAGVPLQVLQQQAMQQDCHFAVDLGARGSATIGGMVSTNAGGTEVLRFGMMREQVLGLEVALADGRIISSMRPLLKNNTGYDLKQLFIGAEGTLGIITKVMLRLRPKPLSNNSALLAVHSYQQVVELLSFMQKRLAHSLACFEVIWENFYSHILENNSTHQIPFSQSYPYSILIETTGSEPELDQQAFLKALESAFESGIVADAMICNNLQQQKSLWAIRDDIDTLMTHLENPQMFDISLPLEHIDNYVRDLINNLKSQYKEAKVITFGHVGDGNIHLAISLGQHLPLAKEWLEQQVYSPLDNLNGSVSAEHGIGLDKKPYLSINRSEDEIAIMRQLKTLFDPKGTLSPGRIF